MRVLEALTWAGALDRFGNPNEILDALPTIVPAAQAEALTRATGQISAFEVLFAEAAVDEQLPATARAAGTRADAAREGAARACTCRDTRWASWPTRSAIT